MKKKPTIAFRNEQVQNLSGLQRPYVSDGLFQFLVRLVHLFGYGQKYITNIIDLPVVHGGKRYDKPHKHTATTTTTTTSLNSIYTMNTLYAHSPHRIFMLRFSRMRANSVVVNCTLPSWSTGMFIRMSFLYAKRLGHLLPKPNGGSMFLSISYISVQCIFPLRCAQSNNIIIFINSSYVVQILSLYYCQYFKN